MSFLAVIENAASRFGAAMADAEHRRRQHWEERKRKVGVVSSMEQRFYVPPRTRAGIRVDHDIALTYSAVWACVRIISETLASLPWNVDRRRPDGGRDRVPEHTVDYLLNGQANPETTSYDFKQAMIAWVVTWGNGYAEIERRNGEPVALWQVPPDRVEPGRDDNGRLAYLVKPFRGDEVVLPARDILHFRGLGFDGLKGYDVISLAAQNIGLGLGMEQFAADFFGSGAHPSGILETDATLGDTAIDKLKTAFSASAQAQGTPVLEEGIKWKSSGVPPEAAQFLESRKLGVLDICRFYRVPPHMVADLDRATFSNIEHQAIEFVTGLMPRAVSFEQECNAKLLPRPRVGQRRLFVRINLNALLRGDIKSRYEAHNIARYGGWASANDILRLEDQNPLPGTQGDVYWAPKNMGPADKFGEMPEPKAPAVAPAPPGNDDGDNGQQRFYAPAYRKIVEDAVGRIALREASRLEDLAKAGHAADAKWAERFYGEHLGYMERHLMPVIVGLAETATGAEVSQDAVRPPIVAWIESRAERSRTEIAELGNVGDLIEHWRTERTAEDADGLSQALELLLFGLTRRKSDAVCQ